MGRMTSHTLWKIIKIMFQTTNQYWNIQTNGELMASDWQFMGISDKHQQTKTCVSDWGDQLLKCFPHSKSWKPLDRSQQLLQQLPKHLWLEVAHLNQTVKHQEGLDRWLGLEDLDEKPMGISLGKNVRSTFFSMTPEQKSWMEKTIRMVIEHAAISEQHRDVAVELHVWHQNRWSSHGLSQIVLLERTLSDVMLRHFCMFISPACPTPWLGCRYSILASPSSFLCWIPHYCMVTKMRPALLPQIDSYVFPFHSIKIHMISPYTS